jgi:K+-sensing histidine kinase KdpD
MNSKSPLPSFNSDIETSREQAHREIFSKVSHDLRTPLSLIIGSLEIYEKMKDQLTEEKKSTLITLAMQEAYRLDNFISNILMMENLENKLSTPKKSEVNIRDLLEECINNPSSGLKNNDIEVSTALEEIFIYSDSLLINKVMSLLFDNTIKHSGSKSALFIECYKEDDSAIIKIHDNGPGIPEECLENIFEKYMKLKPNNNTNASVGIGLTICRKIMALLGGHIIAANSNKYNGAVFTLVFPMA